MVQSLPQTAQEIGYEYQFVDESQTFVGVSIKLLNC
jgi:hypothetical protein